MGIIAELQEVFLDVAGTMVAGLSHDTVAASNLSTAAAAATAVAASVPSPEVMAASPDYGIAVSLVAAFSSTALCLAQTYLSGRALRPSAPEGPR